MLKNIHLKNTALIREADIDLCDGLNILTGETGSGKSMIIGAVNIALGSKASRRVIGRDAGYALAELLFTDVPDSVLCVLDRLGIERNGGSINISRKITADSSYARVNGETVTLADLKEITSLLVDVHGQHEHQSLLSPAKHMDIVDEFGKESVSGAKAALAEEFSHYKKLRKEYSAYDMDEETLAREISLLEYECAEIDEAGLIEGEDVRLENEYKELLLAQKTSDSVRKVYELIGSDSGACSLASEALREMDYACGVDGRLSGLRSALADVESLSKDLSSELEKYISKNSFDSERLKKTGDRLNLINHLKSKYGSSVADILSYAGQGRARLERYKNGTQTKLDLEAKLAQSKGRVNRLAQELSKKRKEAAQVLEPLIIKNLQDLNFLNADFKIDFSSAGKISSGGFDKIEFLISTNPGEPLRPLAAVASGGELSRVMLALKSAAAQTDHIPTLIFDEIDNGISGLTAQRVSEKLCSLSRNHQIICITHLPQIASMADSHFLIEKEITDGNTISGVKNLTDNESLSALAAMVSGAAVTEGALANAAELKAGAQKFKEAQNGV